VLHVLSLAFCLARRPLACSLAPKHALLPVPQLSRLTMRELEEEFVRRDLSGSGLTKWDMESKLTDLMLRETGWLDMEGQVRAQTAAAWRGQLQE
jgi:hypothetical protein